MEPESMLPFEEENAEKEPELPLPEGKMRFKPEELYRFTRIKPFVLRFWESEFPLLKPKKGSDGLAYSRADVEMILAIKHLLYDEGLTLAGARCRLTGEEAVAPGATGATAATRKKKKPAKKTKVAGSTVAPAPAGRVKSPAKRGLPAEGGGRSRVSLEELLPGNAAAAGATGRREKGASKKVAGKKKAAPVTASPAVTAGSEAPELRRKLSGVLRELREILTLLHKGDR